jgi:toxin ParE1/3/4
VRIVITPRAFDDLAAMAGYIARDNPAAAARLVDRVFEVIDLLAEGGLDGPLSTLRSGVEVRSWPIPPLRIFYRREANELHVLRIYHQSRRPL